MANKSDRVKGSHKGGVKQDVISRVRMLYAAFILIGIAVAVRMVWVVLFSPSVRHNAEVMDNGIFRIRDVEAHRGAILSRDGEPLAISTIRYRVIVDFMAEGMVNVDSEEYADSADSLSRMMATMFSAEDASQYGYEYQPASHYYNLLIEGRQEGRNRSLELAPRTVNRDERDMMHRTFPILNGNIGMVSTFAAVDTRLYPSGDVARQTIGRYDRLIVNNEVRNGAGIEGIFNDYLSGSNGLACEQWIAHGFWTNARHEDNRDPVNGCDIVTTIDAGLQRLAHESLEATLRNYEASFGVAIVMEVATGDVLAIVNLGSGEERGVSYTEQVFNHALKTPINPGSTMKLISTLALVELAGYDTETRVDVEHCSPQNPKWVGATRVRDSHDVVGAGNDSNITLEYAFAHSSNLYFAKAIYENFSSNPTRYTDFLRHLGLDSYVGLEAYGEESCRWTRADMPEWNINGSTSSRLPMMAYGYEIEIPPIHMATIYNGIANGGRMVAPRFVRSIKRDGQTIERMPVVTLVERMCSPRTLSVVEECMAAASLYTQGIFANLPVEFGCKTGTAQVLNNFNSVGRIDRMLMNRGINKDDKYYYGSIVCTMPQDNPKYTIYVGVCKQVTDASSTYYGIRLSGTTACDIMEYLYTNTPELHTHLEEAPTPYSPVDVKAGDGGSVATVSGELSAARVDNSEDAEWCRVAVDVGGNATITGIEVVDGVVPDVRGMGLSDALYLLESMGLEVSHTGSGRVRSQSLAPGVEIGGAYTSIELTLER